MTDAMSVLEMSSLDARSFFMSGESYCNFDLPSYVIFDQVLQRVSAVLDGHQLSSMLNGQLKVKQCEGVNHIILNNKDGKFAWRPMELIHPVLYMDLVKKITQEEHWEAIKFRFRKFGRNPRIQCLSIPLRSQTIKSNRAAQVLQWWRDIEQHSIALSLDFPCVAHTDLVDCYGAIYTHSVAWALHGRTAMKRIAGNQSEYRALLGGYIDGRLQDMRQGQTNGIPQGSVLMDFIAELVLGYADSVLSVRLRRQKVRNYKILRYRDDYRIFSQSPMHCEVILKVISEIAHDLGMKLSPSKTLVSDEVIRSSIKADKIAWIINAPRHANPQRQLIAIHEFARNYPNSGSLTTALSKFHKRSTRVRWSQDSIPPAIALVADIAAHNPKTYAIAAAILSKLVQSIEDLSQRRQMIGRIHARFERVPNTGHLQIWLQRLSHRHVEDLKYSEPLCHLVQGRDVTVWNNDWIGSADLKAAVSSDSIINRNALSTMDPAIPTSEVQLFGGYSS